MICTTSLYDSCGELFARYPLAARALDDAGSVRLMVLMLLEAEDIGFFQLERYWHDNGSFCYSLYPWPSGDIATIEPDGPPVPEVVASAVTRGVPLPRHGSLFGWLAGDGITALVGSDTEYVPARQLPRWSVMPLVGMSRAAWPPFVDERFFGRWFWQYYETGNLVALDNLIFGAPHTVFWVGTQAIIGSDCCVVARDLHGPGPYTLRRGCYVDSEVLDAGTPVPSMSALLADGRKTDLAPRFRRYAYDARPRSGQ